MTKRGHFFALEGLDGSGKSLQAQWLAAELRQRGQRVHCVREPGGTETGERIRALFLNPPHPLAARTELLLLFAARAQLLEEQVTPALAAGDTVICERFLPSSYAYQGQEGGGQAPDNWILQLEKFLQPFPAPAHTLLFDLPAKLALQRRHNSDAADRFSTRDVLFFNHVRRRYLKYADEHDNATVINVARDLQQVRTDILHCLQAYV